VRSGLVFPEDGEGVGRVQTPGYSTRAAARVAAQAATRVSQCRAPDSW
jgi:hypothetical protein